MKERKQKQIIDLYSVKESMSALISAKQLSEYKKIQCNENGINRVNISFRTDKELYFS